MSTSFTRTREELARMVLRKLRVLGASQSDVSADMEIIYEAADLRLKEMHRRGIFWRKVSKVPVTFSLSSGVNTASATTDILFPILMTVRDSSRDEPVELIGIREYAAIENKTESGVPTKALWKGSQEFIFHPVPSSNGTAKLTYEKIADDTSAGSAPDVDVSMLRWLRDIIAYDVSDEFGVEEQRIVRLERESAVGERNIRALAVQRTGLTTVAVDDWETDRSEETDYGM